MSTDLRIFTPKELRLIRERQTFDTHFAMGYTTAGGTYIVASTGVQSDSRQPPRDLVAILPGDLGQVQLLTLYVAVNPQVIEEIAEALA